MSTFPSYRFLDPIFFGEYPKEMREMLSSNLPKFTPAEKRLLQNKVDFIGINHYTAIYAKDCISSPCNLQTYEGNALVLATGERDGVWIGKPVRTVSVIYQYSCCFLLLFVTTLVWSTFQTAFIGFYDVPEGMEQIVKYVNRRYKNIPVYITENGERQGQANFRMFSVDSWRFLARYILLVSTDHVSTYYLLHFRLLAIQQ